MNAQIASAAEVQCTVATEFDRGIASIQQVSEQTVRGVQDTSASSNELARLSEHPQKLTHQFKVQPAVSELTVAALLASHWRRCRGDGDGLIAFGILGVEDHLEVRMATT